MKKLIIILALLLALPANATVYSYFKNAGLPYPSLSQRVLIAQKAGIQNYTGTANQNYWLEKFLLENSSQQLGSGGITSSQPVVNPSLKGNNTWSGLNNFYATTTFSTNSQIVIGNDISSTQTSTNFLGNLKLSGYVSSTYSYQSLADSGAIAVSGTASYVITTNFPASRIRIFSHAGFGSGNTALYVSDGGWTVLGANNCVYSIGYSAWPAAKSNSYAYYNWDGSSVGNYGTITNVSSTGFTISNTNGGSVISYIYWEAE
jgi:hypothetical protein